MTGYYPGSKQQVKIYDTQLPEISGTNESSYSWLSNPRKLFLNGKEVEFFTIGELASALNRKPVTIRKWEADGIIPKATYIAPSGDKRGKRRLYTKDQILGMIQIAWEEGLLEPNVNGSWKSIGETNFREKAVRLFKELMEKN